jgi:predicted ATP-dependent Lon-type protease
VLDGPKRKEVGKDRRAPLVLKTEGDGKMGSVCVYKVVIESSDGQETWQKDYIGPATSADDAVRRALSAFKKRADDRVVTVELVDQDSWVEDEAALPPDGDEWVPL